MSFGTGNVDPGTTPTLQVASDVISSVNYQRVKQANPNADQTGAYGIDSDPVRVRPRERGTADYDSGPVTLGTGVDTVLTASTVYPKAIRLTNILAVPGVAKVNVKNTAAGSWLLKDFELMPRQTIVMPLYGAEHVGLQWWSDQASAVIGQVTGWQ